MKLLSALALTAMLGSSAAFAAGTHATAHHHHVSKAAACSHQAHAKHLKGAARRNFMKTCEAPKKAK